MNHDDHAWLERAIDLAEQALDAGHEPFGSVLVDAHGVERFADHNRIGDGDATRHPEFAIARWAAEHLSSAERATSTVYTSGEHCAMCAAAHGWVGLGRIVYASSSAQYGEWFAEFGVTAPPPVAPLPITAVVPNAVVEGPSPELAPRVRALHARRHGARPRADGAG